MRSSGFIPRLIFKDPRARLAGILLGTFVFVAVFADFLANDVPIYVKQGNQTAWPLVDKLMGRSVAGHWQTLPADRIVFTPIAFAATQSTHLTARLLPPLSRSQLGVHQHRHWLGTDRLGRDIAAGMVHGCRKSLFVALLAMIVAFCVGTLIGALAGYWGNGGLHLSLVGMLLVLVAIYYAGYLLYYDLLAWGWVLTMMLVLSTVVWLLGKHVARPVVPLPLDALLLRSIEVFNSVPTLLLLMAIGAMFVKPTLLGLALIIGLLRWTRFARFARAEALKIKDRDYILSARVSGQNDRQILTRYILPESLGPLLVAFAFGVASVVLLESTLSFLGIGVPIEEMTWGSMLGQARSNVQAWWLAVFPGLAIFLLVIGLNLAGDSLNRSLDPR